MKLYTIEETNRNIQNARNKTEWLLKFETREEVKKELEDMLKEIQIFETRMKQRFGNRKGYF
ncbi:hypothetical protein AGMMS49975_11740 [Clostridia bacterium]|nr:hypothetical protein AGMMS49975_11740 [Clostridia bacterium]